MIATAAPVRLETRVLPWTDWLQIEPQWREVFRDSPYRSMFVSPEWVATWLSVFGPQLNPEIVFFYEGDRPAGCCLLVYRTVRAGFIPLRTVHLNTSGEDEADETYVEFNDLLVLEGRERQVAEALRAHLAARSWDQFALDGCLRSAAIEAVLEAFAGLPVSERTERSFYVRLAELRAAGEPFDRSLSKKMRYNLRRTAKVYQQFGPIRIEEASGTPEALAMMDELAELHQQRWQTRNRDGVFHSSRFTEFNRELISPIASAGRRAVAAPAGRRGDGGSDQQFGDRREGLLLPVRLPLWRGPQLTTGTGHAVSRDRALSRTGIP